jgi:hypothetical protein
MRHIHWNAGSASPGFNADAGNQHRKRTTKKSQPGVLFDKQRNHQQSAGKKRWHWRKIFAL